MRLLIIGAVLTGLSWFAAWSRSAVISEYAFFPLWVGYILFANGISEVFFQTSLLTRMRWHFLSLFAISIPMWWFFEYMNSIVQNWHYVFAHPVSEIHYNLQASIDFSTVIAAVLSASFLIFQFLYPLRLSSVSIKISNLTLLLSFLSAFVLFAAMELYPNEAFPLVWIIPILFLAPLNYRFNAGASLLRLVEHGDLALALSVGIATLVTGFFWEFWNFYSLPKWVYTIPYVDFWKLFEMPLLGYFGYPFFGFIVYSYTSLVLHIVVGTNLANVFLPSAGQNAKPPSS